MTDLGHGQDEKFVKPVNCTDQLDVDNLNFNGNTISSTNANGEIYILPNGTGSVRIGDGNILSNLGLVVLDGTVNSIEGPHLAAFISGDNTYPVMQMANKNHDDIDILFDAYWDGSGYKSAHSSNFKISKVSGTLQFSYAEGVSSGDPVSWTTALSIDPTTGSIDIPITFISNSIDTGVLDVDNININGNTISTTNINGNINLSPEGTGTVVINTDLDVDNINIDGNTISSTDTNGDINITPNGTGGTVIEGTVTQPSQPSFSVYLNVNADDVTGDGTIYGIIFNTEEYDIGSNYNNATGIFTAPTDGTYSFSYSIAFEGQSVGAGHNRLLAIVNLSNGTKRNHDIDPNALTRVGGINSVTGSCVIYMDAADTASIEFMISGGTKVVDIVASQVLTWFTGTLLH